MNKPSSKPWGWMVFAALSLLLVAGVGLSLMGAALGNDTESTTGEKIGVIELSGAISDEGASGVLGGSTGGAREIIEQIEKARKDSSIKAVVIRVNSPGGSAAASQEMFNAVQKLKAVKPVVCSMGDLAASGGYYVAAACDTIYANGSTLTGSIGVISQFLNYGALFRKVGLDETTIKSGQFKDAGNPSRPLTPQEKQLFQAMINDVYRQFVDDIAKGRKGKLTRAQIVKLADGRVYTGSQAQKFKLVDKIGGLSEAIFEAAKRASISGEPKVKYLNSRGGVLGSLLGSSNESSAAKFSSEIGKSAGESFARSLLQQLKADESNIPTLR